MSATSTTRVCRTSSTGPHAKEWARWIGPTLQSRNVLGASDGKLAAGRELDRHGHGLATPRHDRRGLTGIEARRAAAACLVAELRARRNRDDVCSLIPLPP